MEMNSSAAIRLLICGEAGTDCRLFPIDRDVEPIINH